ncbi:MAG: Gfo/Idh/MocA family oxidoreductase [Clostridiales bacterium]|nr:Gfo/Idh/MocA family oxidoreductase [Clostridiales bacterium]
MIHVAIVGTGAISRTHIEGLLTFPSRCQIVALCDIYPEKAEAVKRDFQLDARVFADYQDMLASESSIDLVHVCTPPYMHAKISIDSMDAGCNVLVEKPMTTCLSECDQMLEAQRRNQVSLACIAQNRFRNSIYKLKKTLESGIPGRLCHAQVNSFWWRGHSYYDLWWRGLWEKEGGGPTLNHAVHHIDMLNWLEGDLPDEVFAFLANTCHDNSEVEDLSTACLRYSDGTLAQVTSSVIHHGEEQGIILQCENAKISAPWDVRAEVSRSNGFPETGGNPELSGRLEHFYQGLPDLQYEGHTGEIDDVLRALENGNAPLITGEDGRRTVELITAIYKSGFTGSKVKLPILPEDSFYTFEGILKNAVRFHEKKTAVDNFADQQITVGSYQ